MIEKNDNALRNVAIGVFAFVVLGLIAAGVSKQKKNGKIQKASEKAEIAKLDTNQMIVTYDGNVLKATDLAKRRLSGKEKLKNLKITYDEISNITYYKPKYKPRYANENGFYCYITQEPKKPNALWLRVQYSGEDWLFVKSFKIKADDWRSDYESGSFHTDTDPKGIHEWFVNRVNGEEMIFLTRITKSKKAVIRLTGTVYYKDIIINEKQKKALSEVIEVFNLLKY
jgi:hypothetical protein